MVLVCVGNGRSVLGGSQGGRTPVSASTILSWLSSFPGLRQGAMGPPGVPTQRQAPEGPRWGLRRDAALALPELPVQSGVLRGLN